MSSMSIFFWIELVIVLAVIFIGARFNGVGLGIWGGVGLFLIAVLFGVKPTAPPVDVLLIILAVVTAAATMDAAGGRPGSLPSSPEPDMWCIRCSP